MAKKLNRRNWLYTTIWFGLGVGIITLLIAAMQVNKKTVCSNIAIRIAGNEEHKFLTEADILVLIDAKDILNNKQMKDIDIKNMEKKLARNIWVEQVEMFFDKTAVLHINIKEREPVCRIFRQNEQAFYIDSKLYLLPLSTNYSANVPVFTGFSNRQIFNNKDSSALENILKIATYINRNEFWKAQIQQINMVDNENFEIFPTIGNHMVQFGDTTDLEHKFQKLFTFYKTVGTKVGFDKYAVLNVQFKNQLVATNNSNAAGIDTVKANQAVRLLMRNSLDSALKSADTLLKRPLKDSLLKTGVPPAVKRQPEKENNPNNKQTTIINKKPTVPAKPKAVMPKNKQSTGRKTTK